MAEKRERMSEERLAEVESILGGAAARVSTERRPVILEFLAELRAERERADANAMDAGPILAETQSMMAYYKARAEKAEAEVERLKEKAIRADERRNI